MFAYDDFINKVNELGFIANSKSLTGFPNTFEYTVDTPGNSQWWTGDPDTDPALWAIRGVKEKKLVYGGFFKGGRGCISPEWFAVYYRAFHPAVSIAERQERGLLGRYEWQVWQLVEKEGRMLGIHEIRRILGVTPKSGASSADNAINNLCMTCDLVIVGEADMLDKNGRPYNKSIAYDKLENWIPADWIGRSALPDPGQAREKIIRRLEEISKPEGRDSAAKLFNKQVKLISSIK